MRVISAHQPVTISTPDDTDELPGSPCTEYDLVAGKRHFKLEFNHEPGSSITSDGVTEEACVAVLMDRTLALCQKEPSDDYNRALYHLAQAKKCFQHHAACDNNQPPRQML